MTALLLITVLCTALALLARRFGWACTAGMVAGGVLLLCLLIPCTAALWPKGGSR